MPVTFVCEFCFREVRRQMPPCGRLAVPKGWKSYECTTGETFLACFNHSCHFKAQEAANINRCYYCGQILGKHSKKNPIYVHKNPPYKKVCDSCYNKVPEGMRDPEVTKLS